jgi:hypothetical protein
MHVGDTRVQITHRGPPTGYTPLRWYLRRCHNHVTKEEAGLGDVCGARVSRRSPPPPRSEPRQSAGASWRGLVLASCSGAPTAVEARCFDGGSNSTAGTAGGQKRLDRSPEHIADAAATRCCDGVGEMEPAGERDDGFRVPPLCAGSVLVVEPSAATSPWPSLLPRVASRRVDFERRPSA